MATSPAATSVPPEAVTAAAAASTTQVHRWAFAVAPATRAAKPARQRTSAGSQPAARPRSAPHRRPARATNAHMRSNSSRLGAGLRPVGRRTTTEEGSPATRRVFQPAGPVPLHPQRRPVGFSSAQHGGQSAVGAVLSSKPGLGCGAVVELNDYLRVLQRRWAIVAIATLFGLAVGFFTVERRADSRSPTPRPRRSAWSNRRSMLTAPLVSFTPSQLAVYATVGEVPRRSAEELDYQGTSPGTRGHDRRRAR